MLSDFKRPQDLAFVISMMRDDYIQDVAQACIQKKWGLKSSTHCSPGCPTAMMTRCA